MAPPLRYEAAGAVYHVMARGDGGQPVFEDAKDRHSWLDLMKRACGSFGWRVHPWVLMSKHFHLDSGHAAPFFRQNGQKTGCFTLCFTPSRRPGNPRRYAEILYSTRVPAASPVPDLAIST